MGHPNLSGRINAIIDAGNDRKRTIDLRQVEIGKTVLVRFEGEGNHHIVFMVVKTAGPDAFQDKCVGKIVSLDIPKELHENDDFIVIGGACTWNPGSALGMTMFHGSHISVGRNLAWGFKAGGNYTVIPDVVGGIQVIDVWPTNSVH
jgi:hypothetical protein